MSQQETVWYEQASSWAVIWFLLFCIAAIFYISEAKNSRDLKNTNNRMYSMLSPNQKRRLQEEYELQQQLLEDDRTPY